jgi:hypothetical protein
MEPNRSEELRPELNHLPKKQADVLESRSLGTASDSDLLEYEIRQDVIQEICSKLANSISA